MESTASRINRGVLGVSDSTSRRHTSGRCFKRMQVAAEKAHAIRADGMVSGRRHSLAAEDLQGRIQQVLGRLSEKKGERFGGGERSGKVMTRSYMAIARQAKSRGAPKTGKKGYKQAVDVARRVNRDRLGMSIKLTKESQAWVDEIIAEGEELQEVLGLIKKALAKAQAKKAEAGARGAVRAKRQATSDRTASMRQSGIRIVKGAKAGGAKSTPGQHRQPYLARR